MPAASTRPPRVLLDATPLLGRRTGIGRYVEHLIAELAVRTDVEVAATAFTLRGWRSLAAELPAGVRSAARPVPARLLRAAWRRGPFPPVEWLGGRADVVHGTNFVLPPRRRAAGVLSIHDLAYLTHTHTLNPATADLPRLVAAAMRRVGAVTTLAESTRQRIAEIYRLPLEKIVVAPPGVDGRWFDAQSPDAARRRELGLPEQYLLFLGTREPRKGLATLLPAYARLRTELGSAAPELLIVGQQGWGDDPTDTPQDGVRLAGYQPQQVLPEIVAGAVALVMPSLDEGFGMPALEALAAGRPVAVSDIDVLTESTGGFAETFAVGDVDALLAAVHRVIADDGSKAQARKDFAATFSWRACADATVGAYRLALG